MEYAITRRFLICDICGAGHIKKPEYRLYIHDEVDNLAYTICANCLLNLHRDVVEANKLLESETNE